MVTVKQYNQRYNSKLTKHTEKRSPGEWGVPVVGSVGLQHRVNGVNGVDGVDEPREKFLYKQFYIWVDARVWVWLRVYYVWEHLET